MEARSDNEAFQATVAAIREWGRVDGKQVWQITLDHTAFTPGATGTLETYSRSGAKLVVRVTGVTADEERALWHTCNLPLQEGTEVTGRVEGQAPAAENPASHAG